MSPLHSPLTCFYFLPTICFQWSRSLRRTLASVWSVTTCPRSSRPCSPDAQGFASARCPQTRWLLGWSTSSSRRGAFVCVGEIFKYWMWCNIKTSLNEKEMYDYLLSEREGKKGAKSVTVFGSIDITPDGMKAIVTLSAGDMRRSLNILQVQLQATRVCTYVLLKWFDLIDKSFIPPWFQSTSMAYGKVTEDTVYTCTGHPLRSDIANILDWSLNKDFTTAYKRILQWPLGALYIWSDNLIVLLCMG